MKSIKTLMLGAVMALGLAGLAQAQSTTFYIAGSTAFRAQTHQAIMHLLGSTDYVGTSGTGSITSGTTSSEGYPYGYGYTGAGTNLGSSNQALFIGNIAGVGDVIIHTAWTGSESGIYSVCIDSGTGANVNFVADTATTSTIGQNGLAAATPHIPDAAMSDTYQATSQWAGGSTVTYADATTHTCGTLTEDVNSPVAVTYFAFGVTKSGKDDGITNITSELAKYIYKQGNGNAPVTMFLPTYSGTTAKVYTVGRDPDSGTRLSVIGEIGLGNLGACTQYYPYDSSNAILNATGTGISYIKPVPASTVNNVSIALGNGGYTSGGNLVKGSNSENGDQVSANPFRLNSAAGTLQPIGSCLLVYAGISDLASLTRGQVLTFNGVAATNANVQNGSYPLWTYEHMYIHPGSSTTVADLLAAQIKNTDFAGTGAVQRSSMKVKRVGTQDGGAQIQPGTL